VESVIFWQTGDSRERAWSPWVSGEICEEIDEKHGVQNIEEDRKSTAEVSTDDPSYMNNEDYLGQRYVTDRLSGYTNDEENLINKSDNNISKRLKFNPQILASAITGFRIYYKSANMINAVPW